MSANNQPTHRVYTVIKREGQDDFWLNVGLAFVHADGKGFNVILQALPLNAKLILRESSDDEAAEEQPAKAERSERRPERDKSDRPKSTAGRYARR